MSPRSKLNAKQGIDLLWSHQIRRENASLHKEVSRLREICQSSTREAKELRAISEKALTAQENANQLIEQLGLEQNRLLRVLGGFSEERKGLSGEVVKIRDELKVQKQVHEAALGEMKSEAASARNEVGDLRKSTAKTLEKAALESAAARNELMQFRQSTGDALEKAAVESTALRNDFALLRQTARAALENAEIATSAARKETEELRENTQLRFGQFSTIVKEILIKVEALGDQAQLAQRTPEPLSARGVSFANSVRYRSVSRVEDSIDGSGRFETGKHSILP
jgi:hypothetical protein